MTDETKEIQELVEVKTVTTKTGEVIEIPKFTTRKELKLTGLMMGMRKIIKTGKVEDYSDEELTELIFSTDVGIDLIFKMISLALDKDAIWIEDNLDAAEIWSELLPFLLSKMNQTAKKS